MISNVDDWNKRYERLELACDKRSCNPCTYPSCQRFAREKKITDWAVRRLRVTRADGA